MTLCTKPVSLAFLWCLLFWGHSKAGGLWSLITAEKGWDAWSDGTVAWGCLVLASEVSEPRTVCPAGTPRVLLESELGVTLWPQHFLPLPTHLPTVRHHAELPPPLPALDIPMHLVMTLGDCSSLSCSLVMRDLTQP